VRDESGDHDYLGSGPATTGDGAAGIYAPSYLLGVSVVVTSFLSIRMSTGDSIAEQYTRIEMPGGSGRALASKIEVFRRKP
jgi:hypothetical protein